MATKLNPFTGRLQLGGGGGGGGGDISGPGSSTDNALVRWDGTTGTMVQNGTAVELDSGQIQTSFGSNSAPSYSFLTATNCGLFTDGNNTYLSGGGFATLSVGFNVSISGGTTSITQGVCLTSTQPKNTSFTCVYGDYEYKIDTSGAAITATLMNSPIAGQTLVFKDDTGNADVNNITISGLVSGVNIDESTTQVINSAFGSMTLYFNGTQWNVIASVGGGSGGGIGGSVGTTDNAITRADGTGGGTLQGSTALLTDDGAFLAGDGQTSSPSYSFSSATGLGFYKSGTDSIALAYAGSDLFNASSTGMRMSVPLTTASALNVLYTYFIAKTSTPSASPYVVDETYDYLITVNTSSAYTIQLPDAPVNGQSFIIKDATGTGAVVNNITVTTVSGSTLIDRATSYVINLTNGSVTVVYDQLINKYVTI